MFTHAPTPEFLNWLAKGRLADRRLRAVRLWVILSLVYAEKAQAERLPKPFRYADVRDRLFSTPHNNSETANREALSTHCKTNCLCQQTVTALLNDSSSLTTRQWQQRFAALTNLSPAQINTFLQARPFFTVHRSIRADLTHLADMGWIKQHGQGRFSSVSPQYWPTPSKLQTTTIEDLSTEQTWEVLRSLESIAFVKPNLEVIIQSLWEKLTTQPERLTSSNTIEPEKRIFIHLDYILSETMQEHVDTLQEQIEQLWQQNAYGGGGLVQFAYSYKTDCVKAIAVYPVCLHYARRAKYLSAYGHNPTGAFGWHNYRLDRIVSSRLKILPWNHPNIPSALLAMYKTNALPTPNEVEAQLEDAWGFNFYLPRRLLIMRFSPSFAERYVAETDRHPTFIPIDYAALPQIVKQEITDLQTQGTILNILAQRNPQDIYYRAWIRLNDINIVMRLRDWRPNGEVIAPIELREKMKAEALTEIAHYTP